MRRKRILFVCYGAGHVNMVIPLVRIFERDPRFEFKVLGLALAGAALKQNKIPYLGFRDFVDPSRDQRALEIGRRLLPENSHPSVDDDESVAYLGLSYVDLENSVGKPEAEQEYARKGRGAFLPFTVLERVLERLKPDIVVTTNSPRAERAAVLVAKKRGIPTVCMTDLFGLDSWLPKIASPDYADRICVLSEGVRRRYLEAGAAPERVVITGNPSFDSLADPALRERASALRSERDWNGKTVILWASVSAPPDLLDPAFSPSVEGHLFALLEKHPDWRLVIRRHPRETRPAGSLPAQACLSPQTEDLATLLCAVDCVVNAGSTVGLQAALLDKPVANIVLPTDSHVPYVQMGLAVGIQPDQLATEMEGAILKSLREPLPERKKLPRPGSAAGSVAELIRSLVQA